MGTLPPDWELVWSDEFDGEALDTARWNLQIGFGCEIGICGWGNDEWQFYTDREKNVRVEEGHLLIELHEEPVDSAFLARYPGYGSARIEGGHTWTERPGSFRHTSARINTAGKGDWKSGKIEVRARIPDGGEGAGCWPAVWMLPTDNVHGGWPRSGEMDIMEAYGPRMDTVHQSFHWWGGEGTRGSHVQTAKALHRTSWADDFHVYSLEWNGDQAVMSIDGRAYATRRNIGSARQYPYAERFHLLLNIAVGGGALRNGAVFGLGEYPQTMRVDYVRVYRDRNPGAEASGT
jgi:beta-glucanase (GH16 family)